MTAYGFLEVIQVSKGKYLLQQAANSVLGKELICMAQKRGTKTINLVRRHEVVDELKQLGCISLISYKDFWHVRYGGFAPYDAVTDGVVTLTSKLSPCAFTLTNRLTY